MPTDRVIELAVNLDDTTPQVVADAIDTLLADGALDAWACPITMKKQRPATQLGVLAKPDDAERLAKRVLELTGSMGVRFAERTRLTLDRHHETVDTPFGPVRIKVGSLDGQTLARTPEHDDARAAAQQHNVPLRTVLDAARTADASQNPFPHPPHAAAEPLPGGEAAGNHNP
ncbi:MAG: nickel insertion protein [Planctomycetota bacterium]